MQAPLSLSLSLIMEEALNIVERERGNCKLPPGFRFEPTEEEMVFQYLSRKTFSHPLPALVIPDLNVFNSHPSDLPGDGEHDRYFFCNKEGNNNNNIEYGKRMGRASDYYCGYWKATSGSAKRIICSKKMPIIGIRKSYVFHTTDWNMHEYYLALSPNQHTHNSKGSLVRIGNWTLCRIFLKKRVRVYDFLSDSYSSSASSSESDIFTEVSSS